jgi:ATP-binding cassette subfamily B protein
VALWQPKHFIVVYKVSDDKVFVADPVKGLQEYSIDRFIQKWAIPGDENMCGIVLLMELK